MKFSFYSAVSSHIPDLRFTGRRELLSHINDQRLTLQRQEVTTIIHQYKRIERYNGLAGLSITTTEVIATYVAAHPKAEKMEGYEVLHSMWCNTPASGVNVCGRNFSYSNEHPFYEGRNSEQISTQP